MPTSSFKRETIKPDISNLNKELWSARIAYWREYPDKFLDDMLAPDADFTLNVLQRIYIRARLRYKNSFLSATRGTTKSYISQAADLVEAVLYPGKWISMVAPSKEQSCNIAQETYDRIKKNYPRLCKEFESIRAQKDVFAVTLYCGGKYRTAAVQNSSRGGNDSDITVEEVGQTGGGAVFNDKIFVSAFLPRVRMKRFVNNRYDPNERRQRKSYITSASSKQTYAYRVMRRIFKKMAQGSNQDIVLGNTWELTVMLGLKTTQEIEEYFADSTLLDFYREYCSVWTGTTTDSLVTDEALARARKIKYAEFKHCGSDKVRYVVAFDIAREEGQQTADSAIVVVKETKMSDRDNASPMTKYWKDVVYAESFEGADHNTQARRVKQIYANFMPPVDDKEYEDTILVIDANGYGMSIRDELMKDLGDGIPPFAPINDPEGKLNDQIEAGAMRTMYCMKANTVENPEADMVVYYESEFQHGRVRLLIGENEGLEEYKKHIHAKDDSLDSEYVVPYKNTEKLCDQIANLRIKGEGNNRREARIHKSVPRDIHSALKYALRMSQFREIEESANKDDTLNEWEEAFSRVGNSRVQPKHNMPFKNVRGKAFGR
jgi:hypothetical protein